MSMDWKALGYERIYIDGKVQWVPIKTNTQNQ